MKMRTFVAASAALGLLASASAANAVITVGDVIANDLFGTTLAAHSQTMLWDFDAIADSRTAYSGLVLQGPNGSPTSASPPYNNDPLGDTTKYGSTQADTTSTFSALPGYSLRAFSFYIGSPDAYNTLTFNLVGGGSQTFNGNEIWGGVPEDPNGNRNMGYRVYYNFNGAQVSSITFGTGSTNAFEADGLAGIVPEPGTWALMIMGFGGAGAMLRRRKAALA